MKQLTNRQIDELARGYGAQFEPDVDAALGRLHERMANDAAPRPRLYARRVLAIAAAVLVLLAGGWWVFVGSDTSTVYYNDSDAPLAVALPDGSNVLLQEGSRLAYGSDFNTEARTLELDGQGFFEVYPDKARPFTVAHGDGRIVVTGTAFNLRVADDRMEVEVSEGSVRLESKGDRVDLTANYFGCVENGKLITKAAPRLNHHAWRTGILHFENTPVAHALETFYTNWGITCDIAPRGSDCDFPVRGKFDLQRGIEAVLKDIASLGGARLEKTASDRFTLVGPCN